MVLTDYVDRAIRKVGRDIGPGFTEVRGLIHKGSKVVSSVARIRKIRRPQFVMRRLDATDPIFRVVWDIFVQRGPGLASIFSDLNVPVVCPDPYDPGLERRFVDGRDRAVLDISVSASTCGLCGRIVFCQVRANDLPGLTTEFLAEEHVACVKDDVAVMR